jgi:hypothetical protein
VEKRGGEGKANIEEVDRREEVKKRGRGSEDGKALLQTSVQQLAAAQCRDSRPGGPLAPQASGPSRNCTASPGDALDSS